MNSIIIYILCIISGVLIGYILARFNAQKLSGKLEERLVNANNQIEKLEDQSERSTIEKEDIRREREGLNLELTKKESIIFHLEEKNKTYQSEVEKIQEKFTKEFENLANKILDKKSEKFTVQNRENIERILSPLQKKIESFEKRVDDTNKESIHRHAALNQQLLNLKDLNQQISKEAINLTKALKGDSKMQGNWGELVLERVLEKSGLEKDREYEVQQHFTREDGSRVLPDVIINLPGNKKMVVDSKVSLTHYERYVNSENEEREAFLKSHVNSIKKHVEDLSAKNYQDLYEIESPDFVLMFVPIEPAFALALNQDSTLYNKAFEKNIVIVTPTTLLATLRTIDSMWTNEKQQRNAMEIARQAGALYDKFHSLMEDLNGVGKDMDRAKTNYSAAMNKLFEGKGNLITRVENIKKMGAKAKKALPENILDRAKENE